MASTLSHVVKSTMCYLRVAALCEFSSTFVFLSDRDEFVSTASTCDW